VSFGQKNETVEFLPTNTMSDENIQNDSDDGDLDSPDEEGSIISSNPQPSNRKNLMMSIEPNFRKPNKITVQISQLPNESQKK
jgi:hypothetical protein